MPKADAPATKATVTKESTPAAPAASTTAPGAVEPKPTTAVPRTSTCVVDGGKGLHVGRAVNGKVCSYHAMHYDSNGNRR